jgi:predicted RNase H-like HicB family nuclease
MGPAAALQQISAGHLWMGRSDDYRRYAAECLEMANASHDAKSRAALLQMAQVWLRLATQRELHQKEDCPQHET